MNHDSEHSFQQSSSGRESLDIQETGPGQLLEAQAHSVQMSLPLQHSNVARKSLDQSLEVSTSSSTETSRTFSMLQRRLVMMSQSSSSAAFMQNSISGSSNCETQPQAVGKDVSAMAAMTLTPKFTGLCGTVLCFAMNPSTGNMVQIRALLDSGANLSMLNRSIAKAIDREKDFCQYQRCRRRYCHQ